MPRFLVPCRHPGSPTERPRFTPSSSLPALEDEKSKNDEEDENRAVEALLKEGDFDAAREGSNLSEESKLADDGLVDEAESLLAGVKTGPEAATTIEVKQDEALDPPLALTSASSSKRKMSMSWNKVAPLPVGKESSLQLKARNEKWRLIGKRLRVTKKFNFFAQVVQGNAADKVLVRDILQSCPRGPLPIKRAST